jgi:hypothetical protein
MLSCVLVDIVPVSSEQPVEVDQEQVFEEEEPQCLSKEGKWIEVKPVTCPKADRVLDFLDELLHRFGLPHRIITDLGSSFNNHQF